MPLIGFSDETEEAWLEEPREELLLEAKTICGRYQSHMASGRNTNDMLQKHCLSITISCLARAMRWVCLVNISFIYLIL